MRRRPKSGEEGASCHGGRLVHRRWDLFWTPTIPGPTAAPTLGRANPASSPPHRRRCRPAATPAAPSPRSPVSTALPLPPRPAPSPPPPTRCPSAPPLYSGFPRPLPPCPPAPPWLAAAAATLPPAGATTPPTPLWQRRRQRRWRLPVPLAGVGGEPPRPPPGGRCCRPPRPCLWGPPRQRRQAAGGRPRGHGRPGGVRGWRGCQAVG